MIHGAKNGESFSDMMGPSISFKLTTVDIFVIYSLTADDTVKPFLSAH